MKSLLLFVMLFFFLIATFAQAPTVQWQQTAGLRGHVSTLTFALDTTQDSGYIVAGSSFNLDNNDFDYFVAKLAGDGTVQWQKTYGGSGDDEAAAVKCTLDGGYIVAGYTYSVDGDVTDNHGLSDAWILKLDSAGNVEWKKTYGDASYDLAAAIQLNPDGGYIVAGIANLYSAWVFKMDEQGNIVWQNTYSNGSRVHPRDIKIIPGGGYIVCGTKLYETDNGPGFWILRINKAGNKLWERAYGGSGEEANSIQVTNDGGFIVAGYSEVEGRAADYWIMKLGSTGIIRWQKKLGGRYDDRATSVVITDDGGYLVAGSAQSPDGDVTGNHSVGFFDGWLVKLDSTGNLLWQKTYGGSNSESFNAIQAAPGGGYIVAGNTGSTDGDVTSPLHGVSDAWIVKLGPDVMPVTFSSFTAQKQKTSVLLQWQTATEQNSKTFNIQRSTNGDQFTTIGKVKAAGNSTMQLNYSYTDAGAYNANASILYYRIEEADADGRKTFTGVAKVNYGDGAGALFTLSPNPVHNTIRLAANTDIAAAVVKLADINGKTVYRATRHIYASAINEIPAARLAPGVYILSIEGNGVKTSLKVVKE